MRIFGILVLFFGIGAFLETQAQENPFDRAHIEQSGRMFTVKIIPGKKQTQVFILGKEAARLKFEDYHVEARLLIGKDEKEIGLKQKNDYYVTELPIQGDLLKIKIEQKKPKVNEEIEIKLKP